MRRSPSPSIYEARVAAVAAVKEASENLAYWTRQKVVRTHPAGIDEAAARVSVWKTTLAAREAKLESLDR